MLRKGVKQDVHVSDGVDLEKGHGEAGSQAPDDLDQQPRRLGDDGGLGQVVRLALVLNVPRSTQGRRPQRARSATPLAVSVSLRGRRPS